MEQPRINIYLKQKDNATPRNQRSTRCPMNLALSAVNWKLSLQGTITLILVTDLRRLWADTSRPPLPASTDRPPPTPTLLLPGNTSINFSIVAKWSKTKQDSYYF